MKPSGIVLAFILLAGAGSALAQLPSGGTAPKLRR